MKGRGGYHEIKGGFRNCPFVKVGRDDGSAHHSLAVIYITHQPPWAELARWHYQRALAAGHPHNPDLEKMFDAPKTADSRK